MNILGDGRPTSATRTVKLLLVAIPALVLALAMPVSAATPKLPSGDHHSKKMEDTDKVFFLGWNKKVKGYHYRVSGRWLADCGSTKYCWPADRDGTSHDIGSDDAVYMLFSQSVTWKKFEIRTWDACNKLTYHRSTRVDGRDVTSFVRAYAGVNDQYYEGWIKYTSTGGDSSHGTCRTSAEPTSSQCAVGGGGGACVTIWSDLKARAFTYDVWVNPKPAHKGGCYTGLSVQAGYQHTWSSQSLGFSIGYPWGIGVGAVDQKHSFTASQGQDAYSDPNLSSPKVCQGGPR